MHVLDYAYIGANCTIVEYGTCNVVACAAQKIIVLHTKREEKHNNENVMILPATAN